MKGSLKDQASVNAQKWAQQRKEQLERSRNISRDRERTNFAAMGDMMVGQRGSSAQKQQTFIQPPIERKQSYTKPIQQYQPDPPRLQKPETPQDQLRLLKAKMSTGQTNSRQEARQMPVRQDSLRGGYSSTNTTQDPYDKIQNDNYRKQFNPIMDFDETPTKSNARPPIKKQNTYQQEINGDEYQQQMNSYKKPPPMKKSAPEPKTQPKTQQRTVTKKQPQFEEYQSSNYDYYNPHDEEAAVATGNKNLPPVEPYADPDEFGELQECPAGCGRKFNPKSLQKHVKICQKVFQTKRKEFNTKETRIIDDQHAQLLRQQEQQERMEKMKEKKQPKKQQKLEDQPLKGQKKPKWQAQSEAFRAILKQNTGKKLTYEEQAQINQAQDIGLVQCNYCGRKFNETAAARHIPFCQQKAKVSKIKQGVPQPPSKNPPQRRR